MSTATDWRLRESKHLSLASQEQVHGSSETAERFYRIAALCAEQARAEERADPGGRFASKEPLTTNALVLIELLSSANDEVRSLRKAIEAWCDADKTRGDSEDFQRLLRAKARLRELVGRSAP